MEKRHIIIAGTTPPPVGGVTIHVMRLISSFNTNGIDHKFVDLRPRKENGKFSIMLYINNLYTIFKLSQKAIIHYQLNNWFEITIISLICKLIGAKIITTVHSFRPEEFTKIKKIYFYIAKKNIDVFIAPSKTIQTQLIKYKVKNNKIVIINTYLLPSYMEINAKVPDDIMDFINKSKIIVVANASKIYLDNSNTDVYGLDMCIEACRRIPKISFIFCVPLIKNRNYYEKCKDLIKEYNIEDRFLLLNRSISFVSLFKYANIFVRPTSTDSYGISVEEAISCDVPTIASDVCERTVGTILFKSRDVDDFVLKIQDQINKKQKKNQVYTKDKSIQCYIDLYNSIDII